MKENSVSAAFFLVTGILFIILLNFRVNRPPEVIPADGPGSTFSAARASEHLPHIASVPNPIGSQANEKVRGYIIEQLQEMGFEPEVQQAQYYFNGVAASLSNILIRIPGSSGRGQAILFMGHYDTVSNAPGASDDGSAVVSLLELIRMLQHHPQLYNDLIFFFPDGEERGLLGAQAFLASNPWAHDILMVINLEAMGTSGQSIMFETGERNLNVIREFRRAAPYPLGTSLSMEIYNRMPNSTDFAPFRILGYQGLNFAYIGNSFDYHTMGDNIENTDLRSIQHHGSHAAALALHLGNLPLENVLAVQDAVYFNTFGNHFVFYPYSWVMPITLAVVLLVIILLGFGIYKGKIRTMKLLAAFVAFVFLLAILYYAFHSFFIILSGFFPGGSFRLLQYHQQGILLGLFLIATAFIMWYYRILVIGVELWQAGVIVGGIFILLLWGGQLSLLAFLVVLAGGAWLYFVHRNLLRVRELWAGALLAWTIVAALSGIYVPGVSYLFAWPLLFALFPFAMALRYKVAQAPGWTMAVMMLIFAMPLLGWFPLTLNMFQQAMGLQFLGVMMVFAGLMSGLLIPHFHMITNPRPWLMPSLLLATGLVILALNTMGLEYDQRHRRSNMVIHASVAQQQQAFWITFDARPDEYTMQFLTPQPDSIPLELFFPYHRGKVPGVATQYLEQPQPVLRVLGDEVSEGERVLRLHLQTHTRPEELTFFFNTGESQLFVRVDTLDRHSLPFFGNTKWRRFLYFAPPEQGITLTLYTAPGQNLQLHLNEVDHSGLPEIYEFAPRPPHMMSRGDRRIRSYSFEF